MTHSIEWLEGYLKCSHEFAWEYRAAALNLTRQCNGIDQKNVALSRMIDAARANGINELDTERPPVSLKMPPINLP